VSKRDELLDAAAERARAAKQVDKAARSGLHVFDDDDPAGMLYEAAAQLLTEANREPRGRKGV
jgi:hypothetical protein